MHTLFAVGPHTQCYLKNNTECFHNAGPRTQRKTKEIVKTFKEHGPHRRNDKSGMSGVYV